MNHTFFIYLMQSALSIAFLLMAYKAFFANQSYFRINRIILLVIIGFGFLGPLLTAAFYAGIAWANVQIPGGLIAGNAISNTLNEFIVRPGNNDNVKVSVFGLLLLIYVIGVVIQLIRLIHNFYQLMRLFTKSEKIKSGKYTFVLLPEGSASFSFFNWLFLDKSLVESNAGSNQIITHEKIHSIQKHSIDILLLEFLLVWQWFNPFVYLLKKAVIENHEYLADRGTLNEIKDLSEYKLLLFKNILQQSNYTLTNNFSYSLIKKRLKMMEKENSLLRLTLTSIAFTFVFALVALSCSNKVKMEEPDSPPTQEIIQPFSEEKGESEENSISSAVAVTHDSTSVTEIIVMEKFTNENGNIVTTISDVDKMPEYPGGEKEMFKFLGNNIIYPEEAIKNSVEGKVYINFTIEEDGSLTNIHIRRGIGGGCDEEAMRVIKLMPNWNPATLDGENIRVHEFVIPINFKLN